MGHSTKAAAATALLEIGKRCDLRLALAADGALEALAGTFERQWPAEHIDQLHAFEALLMAAMAASNTGQGIIAGKVIDGAEVLRAHSALIRFVPLSFH
jgi:hypothetical protein